MYQNKILLGEAHESVNESAAAILACQNAADVQAADADDIKHICSHADHRVLSPRGSEGRCLGRCSCWILRSSCLLQEVYAFAVLVALGYLQGRATFLGDRLDVGLRIAT